MTWHFLGPDGLPNGRGGGIARVCVPVTLLCQWLHFLVFSSTASLSHERLRQVRRRQVAAVNLAMALRAIRIERGLQGRTHADIAHQRNMIRSSWWWPEPMAGMGG